MYSDYVPQDENDRSSNYSNCRKPPLISLIRYFKDCLIIHVAFGVPLFCSFLGRHRWHCWRPPGRIERTCGVGGFPEGLKASPQEPKDSSLAPPSTRNRIQHPTYRQRKGGTSNPASSFHRQTRRPFIQEIGLFSSDSTSRAGVPIGDDSSDGFSARHVADIALAATTTVAVPLPPIDPSEPGLFPEHFEEHLSCLGLGLKGDLPGSLFAPRRDSCLGGAGIAQFSNQNRPVSLV